MSEVIKRKSEHLELCLKENVQSHSTSFWDKIQLPHIAAPEINFDDIVLTQNFLGTNYSTPFLISSMTGGCNEGNLVNERLARLSASENIPMGLGSLRWALHDNGTQELKAFRIRHPKAKLWANIGLVQLNYEVSVDDVQRLCENLEADALVLHLNPLQEAIQREGNRNFSNLLGKIPNLKKQLKLPFILKETGCGLDPMSCQRAQEVGIDALDIAGLGGTHWGFIEGLRDKNRQALGEIFKEWGLPSPDALRAAKERLPKSYPLISSGGIRHGLDVARSLYLGAHMVGMAMGFLKAAHESESGLKEFFELQKEALKIALFCMGKKYIKEIYETLPKHL